MASSAISFKGRSTNPKDAAIGAFLDCLQQELRVSKSVTPESKGWLENARQAWQKEWDEMPPGCKDIELDTVLTSLERQTIFSRLVDQILERIQYESHEPEFLIREITKIKRLISDAG